MAMTLEVLASGYGLLEGPRVDDQNRLYFSDVPNGGVYRRSPNGEVETLIAGRKGVGGIAINQRGGFVCSGRGLIYWDEATRTSRNLFTEWEGRPLKGLNDLQPDDHGSVFVGSLEFDALSIVETGTGQSIPRRSRWHRHKAMGGDRSYQRSRLQP